MRVLTRLMETMTMTTERTTQGWRISTMLTDGYGYDYLVSQHYIGYTKREAQALFREYIKES